MQNKAWHVSIIYKRGTQTRLRIGLFAAINDNKKLPFYPLYSTNQLTRWSIRRNSSSPGSWCYYIPTRLLQCDTIQVRPLASTIQFRLCRFHVFRTLLQDWPITSDLVITWRLHSLSSADCLRKTAWPLNSACLYAVGAHGRTPPWIRDTVTNHRNSSRQSGLRSASSSDYRLPRLWTKFGEGNVLFRRAARLELTATYEWN